MRRVWGLGVAGTLVTAMGCATLIGLDPADQGTGGGAATTGTGGMKGVASAESSGASSSSAESSGASGSSSGVTATSSSGSSTTSSSSGTVGGSCNIIGGPPPNLDPNAIMCPMEFCPLGPGGCMFVFSDNGPQTTIGLAENEACAAGTLTPDDPGSMYYGAGIGFNLGPDVDGGSPAPVQLTGDSITVQLSNIPFAGARLVVLMDGQQYCFPIQESPVTIPWTMFNTLCYHDPPDGAYLQGPPATPYLTVSVLSDTDEVTEVSFDFCVEKLTVTTM
jgi:hypothetical protein